MLAAAVIGSGLAAAAPERRSVAATVTVAVSGGGRVHSQPAGPIDCGTRCSAQLEIGTSLVVRALPDAGRALSGWDGECSGRSTTCALVVEGPTSISATFGSPVQLETPKVLDVTRSVGGRVVSDPAGFIDCGTTCTTAWPDGGELTLRAEPDSGFTFAEWAGDCTGALCRVSLDQDRDVTALFRTVSVLGGSATLTVGVRLQGTQNGAVDVLINGVEPEEGDCDAENAPCQYQVVQGARVELTPADGTLDAWEGACVGNADVCRFVFTGATAVTGVFRAGGPVPSFGVNVARAGNGRVVSTPRGIDCGPNATCAAAFGTKTRVRLTATATGGSTFNGWSGDCGGTADCSVVADTTRSVIATFRLARQRLSVEIRGRGVVRSTPVGIACPPDCAFAFRERENVTLTAVPEAGSRFVAWDGACTGPTCTLSVAAAAVARATFERCATLDFGGFAVRTLGSPRRIRISVRLTGGATVRLALLRGRAVVKRFAPRRLGAGTHRFVLRPGRAGRHGVRMTMADRCGGSKARTRVVRVR